MDLLGGGLVPLAGGYSGETFLAEVAGERTRRTHLCEARGTAWSRRLRDRRGRAAPGARAVAGPRGAGSTTPDAATGPGLLVTTFLPGERLDLLLPRLPAELRSTVGHNLGLVLARLSQMPMLRPGPFVDGALRVEPLPPSANDLVQWVENQVEGTVLGAWGRRDLDHLLALADRAQRLLDTIDRTCLVHGDFNPKNLLVDPPARSRGSGLGVRPRGDAHE